VHDQEVAHDGVEGRVAERKLVGVCLAEVESGMQPASERDHRAGDIYPHHRSSSFGCA
jgi:hypothetical protein